MGRVDDGGAGAETPALAEELYRVGPGFPRLTRASVSDGVPAGVGDITYSVDLAACAPWRFASRPEEATELLAALRA